MARFFAGVLSCFLLVTGAFLLWQGRAQEPSLPKAPPPRLAAATPVTLSPIPNAPSADPKSKEEKRFARADTSRSRATGSTGLGLAIVAGVVAAHRGRVTVSSRPGETVFTISLPLVAAAPLEPERPQEPPRDADLG